MKIIQIKNFKISNSLPFALFAGPCQVENMDHSLCMAENLVKITSNLNIPFIYKSSFDKANRSSISGKRGAGMEESLKIFEKIKENFDCLIVTDVHKEEQCAVCAEVVDILQIPAYLCRQTDLLCAAAKTGKPVKVKKGQFLAPWDIKQVVGKLEYFGTKDIFLTERGVMFGYNNLISDMRSLSIMAETGYPVVFDATHSVQFPGGLGTESGGQRKYVELLAKSAIAAGVAAIFMEVHQDPENAPSDGSCMLHLKELERLLRKLQQIDSVVKN